MKNATPVIEANQLVYRYGHVEAVNGLNLRVQPGVCYGLLGRNGAGKTTTIKCLLNLLRAESGAIRMFGLDPTEEEVAIKKRLAYVPDQVSFYPWMSVREALDYCASFRDHWNRDLEQDLIQRFGLELRQKTAHLSKGQKTQLALLAAICADPDLLILDEPTSGLDPIVRREFIETVIGAYQDEAPGERTILVSTHLISEFEGLIDEFTMVHQGREVLTLDADDARARFRRIRARYAEAPPALEFGPVKSLQRNGREIELVVNGNFDQVIDRLKASGPEAITTEALTLEEIFVATLK
jgi:ABC-2 type transport system ATP-binding protein